MAAGCLGFKISSFGLQGWFGRFALSASVRLVVFIAIISSMAFPRGWAADAITPTFSIQVDNAVKNTSRNRKDITVIKQDFATAQRLVLAWMQENITAEQDRQIYLNRLNSGLTLEIVQQTKKSSVSWTGIGKEGNTIISFNMPVYQKDPATFSPVMIFLHELGHNFYKSDLQKYFFDFEHDHIFERQEITVRLFKQKYPLLQSILLLQENDKNYDDRVIDIQYRANGEVAILTGGYSDMHHYLEDDYFQAQDTKILAPQQDKALEDLVFDRSIRSIRFGLQFKDQPGRFSSVFSILPTLRKDAQIFTILQKDLTAFNLDLAAYHPSVPLAKKQEEYIADLVAHNALLPEIVKLKDNPKKQKSFLKKVLATYHHQANLELQDILPATLLQGDEMSSGTLEILQKIMETYRQKSAQEISAHAPHLPSSQRISLAVERWQQRGGLAPATYQELRQDLAPLPGSCAGNIISPK